MIVDMYCHHIPRPIAERVEKLRWSGEGESGAPRLFCPVENGDPEVRLRIMDSYGVDTQALSLTTEVLDGFGASEAAEICRLANSANYALCKSYPDRFVNVCAISLRDMDSALDELARSINELDCRAVIVSTNQNGKGLDSAEYFPFYEKLVEHDLPLLLHPAAWKSYPLIEDKDLMSRFGWPFDSTQAVWRLIFCGILDRFPTLKIVMHHLGAMFPYFAGRIRGGVKKLGKLPEEMPKYWMNIYGDSALSGGPAEAYACGYAFFGPDRVVYGSDYPFGPEAGEHYVKANLAGLTALNIPALDKEKILGENARRLLKLQ